MRNYDLLGERFLYGEFGQEIRLDYALVIDGNGETLRYGLRVMKHPGTERTEIPGLSDSREQAEGLGRKMMDAGVTPVVLQETLEDLLQQ